jgi:hypothetical protein
MYSYVDSDLPETSIVRYRLKQVDFDGEFEYSQEIPVELTNVNGMDFSLAQNYPNPFNPVTTIRYTLPQTADVRLYVSDALGNRINLLVDRVQHAGAHHVFFDATDIPSGAYFYHLEYDGKRITRKMTVLR